MAFNDVIEKTGMVIDAAGVAVIVSGAAIAFVIAAGRRSRRKSDVYRRFRQQLGQTILLGLELLVAGDIVRTVAASPSLISVAILAAIVLIRTFLSFSLEVEITGRWPWQKHEIAGPLDQVPTIAESECLMIGKTDLARHAGPCSAGGTTDDGAAPRSGLLRSGPVVLHGRDDRIGRSGW
jgi:uncharacterized membrane protein